MLSEDQVRKIIEAHLAQTVKIGLIHGGQTDVGVFKIDPPKSMKWTGAPAWEIDFIYEKNVTVIEGLNSSSREYRYRQTLVVDEKGQILHATKPKLEKEILGPEFSLDL